MKQGALKLMQAVGLLATFRMANRDKALIVTYHRFSEKGVGLTTSARTFREQLDYLTSHYQVVPLPRLVEHLASGASLPHGLAAITIDDGYRDAYEIAFPILSRRKVPATLFAVTDFLDQKIWLWTDRLRFLTAETRATRLEATINDRTFRLQLSGRASRLEAAAAVTEYLKTLPDEAKDEAIKRIASSLRVEMPDSPPREYDSITWQQAREMDRAGLEIGSHTLSHPILTNVNDERLEAELSRSRARLEDMLGRQVGLFCYPNGNYDARVSRAVERAGYRCAVTVEAGLNESGCDLFALRRVHTEQDFARFIQGTSGFEQVKGRVRGALARAAGERFAI
ncbi:MAG TPA: polysaccharide deacetylase family protein [Blastocatellia bacterium]|nr:polysaccharide deacetylase family protein [Blastocatellia bacterium]